MQNFLQSEGYRVLIARDGYEATNVHLAHKDEIALVVLDLGLPKLNGWEVLQRMKNANPELKAVIASGYMTAELESAMAQEKLRGVIMKPYKLNDVLRKICAALHSLQDEEEPRLLSSDTAAPLNS
jgi:DNA-binding response OmpR family regulator